MCANFLILKINATRNLKFLNLQKLFQSQCVIHVIVVCKPSTLSLGHFFVTLKKIVFILPPKFQIVMLGYFNGNMFDDKSKDAQNPILFMYNHTCHINIHAIRL